MSIRVTDSYLSSILVGDLNRSLGMMLEQQRMAGSMRRVNSYADDPRAVGTIQRYNALIANNDDYSKNVTRSRIMVDATDVALQNISEVMADVRVITMRESSALGTSQSMSTTMVEVENLANRLMDVLNTTVEGNYIFSGRDVGTPPFVRSGTAVVYQGDDDEITSRTGPNSTMAVNIPGSVSMGSRSSTLGGQVDMAPSLQGTTLLSDLDLGQKDSGKAEDTVAVGVRLDNIGIPKGAKIKRAYLQFTKDDADVEAKPSELTLQAELTGIGASFTENKHDITSRKKTKASVIWKPEPWRMGWERSKKHQSPDLSSLVQEVVAQDNWHQGSSLVLIITGTGERDTISFDGGGRRYGPMLHIELE